MIHSTACLEQFPSRILIADVDTAQFHFTRFVLSILGIQRVEHAARTGDVLSAIQQRLSYRVHDLDRPPDVVRPTGSCLDGERGASVRV